MKINPTHFKAKVNLAIILEKEGKNEEAFTNYEQALKIRPDEARIYHNLGINMKRSGNLHNALSYYKSAMDLEPDNSVYLYNTGVLYNLKQDFSEAIDMLEKSIENNRENVYAYLALGDAFERQDHVKKAIYVYRDLMSLNVNVHGLKEKLTELEDKLKQEENDVKAREAAEAEE